MLAGGTFQATQTDPPLAPGQPALPRGSHPTPSPNPGHSFGVAHCRSSRLDGKPVRRPDEHHLALLPRDTRPCAAIGTETDAARLNMATWVPFVAENYDETLDQKVLVR